MSEGEELPPCPKPPGSALDLHRNTLLARVVLVEAAPGTWARFSVSSGGLPEFSVSFQEPRLIPGMWPVNLYG